MFVFMILSIVVLSYYMYFRSTRRSFYEFCKTIPDVGSFPILGHMHWFVGGPESEFVNLYIILNYSAIGNPDFFNNSNVFRDIKEH